MDEPRGYHTKKSQSRIIQKITYMQNLKCDANELIYETDSQTIEDRLAKGEETWGRGVALVIATLDSSVLDNGISISDVMAYLVTLALSAWI